MLSYVLTRLTVISSGGKKGSCYHDDILNVKYLPGFKWTDLTEQIAKKTYQTIQVGDRNIPGQQYERRVRRERREEQDVGEYQDIE